MVIDGGGWYTSGAGAGVWAAGIQVEAAANPKESSPWLPAPASTGLQHADLLLVGAHARAFARVSVKYRSHVRVRIA